MGSPSCMVGSSVNVPKCSASTARTRSMLSGWEINSRILVKRETAKVRNSAHVKELAYVLADRL